MGGPMALRWCMDMQGRHPADRRTAEHVSEWLAGKAAAVANTDEERTAVESARVWAAGFNAAKSFTA